MGRVILTGGRVIDPSSNLDAVADLVIEDGSIAAVGPGLAPAESDAQVWDVSNCIIGPGLVDIHVHLRTPGQEHKEDIVSGTAAAAAGGYTTVCFMPNTQPPLDDPRLLESVLDRAAKEGIVRVYGAAAVTRGLQGRELAPLTELRAAGAVVFTDDGLPVADSGLMRAALLQARDLGVPVAQHTEDPALTAGGVAHPCPASERLGLPPYPPESEAALAARDCVLASVTGSRLHVQHVSAAATVKVLAAAKERGVPVTAEVTPHHLLLTADAQLDKWGRDPVTKVNPPLRGEEDRQSLIQALLDGVIDCIATDHAPHHREDKSLPYEEAAFGISGLETGLSASVAALITPGLMDWPRLLRLMSTVPARILGLPGGTLAPGSSADVVVIDPHAWWLVDPVAFFSRGRNTPMTGRRLPARVVLTLVGGRIAYNGLMADNRYVENAAGGRLWGEPLHLVGPPPGDGERGEPA